MDARPIEQWTTIFGKLPQPEGVNAERLIAGRIVGDLLLSYRGPRESGKTRYREDRAHDEQQIANAMQAYARMMFDAGVRP